MAWTVVLVNLASVMERADEALLPGAYREVGLALHASPARLGSLTFLRSIVQASCFPLAAYAAQFHDRTLVIALGALIWSIATLFVSISSTFLQVALSRALNGVGLAIVVPAIQSIIADSTTDLNRGSAFGWLQLTGNLGSVVGGLCAVLLSGEVFFGIAGWRVAFILVAFVSVLVGALVYFFTVDPRNSQLRSSPIFAEIVPQNSRATVYALDRSFESVLASFAPPIVGLLAQYVYGYVPFPDGKVDQGLATRKNTRALAEAVYTAVGPPMAVCSAVYSLLYWTYPQDRDKALQFKYMDVNQQALELSTKLHEDMFEKSEEVLLEESRQENAHLLFEGHEVKLGLNT